MKRHSMSIVVGCLALAMTACGEPIDMAASSDQTTSTPVIGDGDSQSGTTVADLPPQSEELQPEDTTVTTREGTVPTTTATTTTVAGEPASNGEVPAVYVNAVLEHTADLTGAAASELAVVDAAAYEWPDGSLGCPEPDQVYTQAITPGYRVVVAHGSDRYDYRLNESGFFRLCEGQGLTPPDDNS